MSKYILIAYKPEEFKMSCGYDVDTSASGHLIYETDGYEELVAMAASMLASEPTKEWDADYEITVIQNGMIFIRESVPVTSHLFKNIDDEWFPEPEEMWSDIQSESYSIYQKRNFQLYEDRKKLEEETALKSKQYEIAQRDALMKKYPLI